MSEQKNDSEQVSEKKEYNFQEGAEQISKRMNALLPKQNYVVVAIAGDTDVGKTTLAGNLGKRCTERNIPYIATSSINMLSLHTETEKIDKGIIILEAMISLSGNNITEEDVTAIKTSQDSYLQETGNQIGMPLSKIDLRIFIYRPDKPITKGDRMLNDIIINNEHAIDSPSKFRYKK